MREQVRQGVVLIVVSAVVFVTRLGATGLWDDDETFFAQTAREMYERGDLVVPTFNRVLFSHKPPFMYWMMMEAYHLLGVTEFAARIPSAMFGTATVLLLWRLGSRLYSARVGFWAGLILATSLNFVVIARAATTDAELVFFCTLPIYLFARGMATKAPSNDDSFSQQPWGEEISPGLPSWRTYALIYAAMGAAVLVKGPIGVILPTTVLGLFNLCRTAALPDQTGLTERHARFRIASRFVSPLRFARTAWQMRPLTAIGMVLLVAGPWFFAVALKTRGAFLEGFFGVHHFHRFTSPMDNHPGPVWFYLAAICVGFFPWIIFLLPSLIELGRRIRELGRWRPADILVAAWFAVWMGFFSMASTKFPHYVIPAYPALALLTACFIDRWLAHPEIYGKVARCLAWCTLAAAGIAIFALTPVISRDYLQGEHLEYAGLPLIAGATVCGWLSHRRLIPATAAVLTFSTVAFLIAVFGAAAAQVDRHQNPAHLADAIGRRAPDGHVRVGTWHYFRPGLAYYCNRLIEQLGDEAAAKEFLQSELGRRFLVTTESDYLRMAGSLPPKVGILERSPWFLKTGETVVLLGATEAPLQCAPQPNAVLDGSGRRN